MANFELAQVNIARLIAPIDDPRIAGFVGQLDEMNALAEGSPGFVWRLKSESGNATDVPWNNDPLLIVNMSVWTGMEELKAYTCAPAHLDVFQRRREWFEKPSAAHYCLWWVHAGHRPTVAEAKARLLHYERYRATPHAFWFPQAYPASAAAID